MRATTPPSARQPGQADIWSDIGVFILLGEKDRNALNMVLQARAESSS